MKKPSLCRLTALFLALVLLLGLTGCSVLRDVVGLAETLIESAEITNSGDPVPAQSAPEPLHLLPEKEETAEEADPAQPLQPAPVEEAPTAQEPIPAETPAQQETPAPTEEPAEDPEEIPELEEPAVLLGHEYTSKDDVALYLHLYQELPPNFITKSEARKAGWEGGSLEGYRDIPSGSCIGGDRFGNNEGLLPKAKGRTYYECDIDTQYAKSRGAKRIVYSNDGLIYYTKDHYEHFELLYGEE